MVEIWIHRKCASEEDVITEPTTYCKDQTCQYCGVWGRVHLYEQRSGRELVANFEGAQIGKSESIPSEHIVHDVEGNLIVLTDEGGHVTLEEIHAKSAEVAVPEPPEEVVIEAEGLTDGQAEVLEELIEFAEKEPLIESITIEGVPDNETMSLDAQIAELQAKKDALEAGE